MYAENKSFQSIAKALRDTGYDWFYAMKNAGHVKAVSPDTKNAFIMQNTRTQNFAVYRYYPRRNVITQLTDGLPTKHTAIKWRHEYV